VGAGAEPGASQHRLDRRVRRELERAVRTLLDQDPVSSLR
jgi:hypothetical protein